MSASDDHKKELAHGGIISRAGDIATLGDGSRWWLNGEQWARDEVDATIARSRAQQRKDNR